MKSISTSRVLVCLAAAILSAAVAAGCSVEAEVPDVRVTQRGVVFHGATIGVAGDQAMASSFSQEHKKIDFPDGLASEVRTLSVSLRATSGVSDLSFIHYMRVTMAADDGDREAIELGVYEPAPGAVAGHEIRLTTLNPVNVFAAWNTDRAKFTLEVVGALPEHDWTGDVTAHFTGKIKYSY